MSSNTIQRIVSALILFTIVIICIFSGIKATLFLILIVGMIAVDEIYCNFLKKPKYKPEYFLTHFIFIAPFAYINFINNNLIIFEKYSLMALGQSLILLIYLFFLSMSSDFIVKASRGFSFGTGLFILIPTLSLSALLNDFPRWKELLLVLLFVTIGMDTGAWFFGKNFGKRKLWKKVSPKKTVEGLIGGAFTAGLAGTLCWKGFFNTANVDLVKYFTLFFMLGVLSQLGDLIQSKLKRQFEIKDSGTIIPGHGGVYDRIDSLLFLTPFFYLVIKFFIL